LRARDDSCLLRGRPVDANERAPIHADVPEHAGQPLAAGIVADRRHEVAAGTERHDVLRHVRRAAQRGLALTDPDDGDRRLRADPLDVADQVHVQHGVADDGDSLVPGAVEQRCQPHARQGGRHGGATYARSGGGSTAPRASNGRLAGYLVSS
jgi:hypothetical protein